MSEMARDIKPINIHPDTGGKSSEIRFKEISGAYAVIGNDELRQNYD